MTDQLQDRICRACEKSYKYPQPKSLATRFYCQRCAQLPKDARGLFETFNKRLRRMTKDIANLEKTVEQLSASNGHASKD